MPHAGLYIPVTYFLTGSLCFLIEGLLFLLTVGRRPLFSCGGLRHKPPRNITWFQNSSVWHPITFDLFSWSEAGYEFCPHWKRWDCQEHDSWGRGHLRVCAPQVLTKQNGCPADQNRYQPQMTTDLGPVHFSRIWAVNLDDKFIGEKVTSGQDEDSFDQDKVGKGPRSLSLLFYH